MRWQRGGQGGGWFTVVVRVERRGGESGERSNLYTPFSQKKGKQLTQILRDDFINFRV